MLASVDGHPDPHLLKALQHRNDVIVRFDDGGFHNLKYEHVWIESRVGQASLTCCSKFGLASCRGDTFTEMVASEGSTPLQETRYEQDSTMTKSPRCPIKPASSAMLTVMGGAIIPYAGCLQRSSASAPCSL